jgi:protocatechuate 3,4-dioxygenase beta subunit
MDTAYLNYAILFLVDLVRRKGMPVVRNALSLVVSALILVSCAGPQITSTVMPTKITATTTIAPSQTPSETDAATVETGPMAPTQTATLEPPVIPTSSTVLPGPDCAVGLPSTRPDMEGPYFLEGSPEKASLLEPGMSGTPLTISGYVMTVDCKWIPGAKLDFWQADANGDYDLQGYRLRGHVFTDENGRYQIETILPAPYEPRPRHIHVNVSAPGRLELTTQLYFPGDAPYPDLTVALSQNNQGTLAEFNFVLEPE